MLAPQLFIGWVRVATMCRFFVSIFKSAVPTAFVLAGIGFLLAEYAGVMVASHEIPRQVPVEGETIGSTTKIAHQVTGQLRVRLPITLAVFGFGLVTFWEGLRSIWAKPSVLEQENSDDEPQTVDELLNQLAARVEAETKQANEAKQL
jgi:hypothetical protein